MNKTKITIITLSIILALSLGYITYSEVYIPHQEQNFIEGYNQGALDIIIRINQEGKIPITSLQDNQTQLNWIPIETICQE